MSKTKHTDVLVIGGGINGCAIARDLAGRGFSVTLVEKDDLACATSSASTKLIHGGLRYLEHYDFRLVRDALREREVMLRSAPHIIWPLTFVLPHHRKLRPWWMIRLGLYVYDFLGGKKTLPSSKGRQLPGSIYGQSIKPEFRRGFTYSDCWVEDTRLVVLNAIDAKEKGAEILTRTECVDLQKHPKGAGWQITLHDHVENKNVKVHADMVVNASGPWVAKTLDLAGKNIGKHAVRWVKGSHIIVPRLYQGEHAYILQNEDKRIVFMIPYERKYTLVGTTDIEYDGDIDEVRIDVEEVHYLVNSVNKYLRQPLRAEQVQWTYSGVRPLVDDGHDNAAEVTRDYVLELDEHKGAPILSIYGGKITTSRKLSEQVADQVVGALGRGGKAWTADAMLPGAEGLANFQTYLKTLKREYNWLPEALAFRLSRAYGSRSREMLRGMKRISDMGEHLGDQIYEFEISYLATVEWAMTAEDILWRRSKLGAACIGNNAKEYQKSAQTHFKQAQRNLSVLE